MSYVQLGTNNTSSDNTSYGTGAPTDSGDGINWPYNPNGDTPNFNIPWDQNPSVAQIEAIYQKLMVWLKTHIGADGFYNGAILLLQMTVDIGQHLKDSRFSKADKNSLAQFLSNQIQSGGGLFLQLVIQIAAEGAAVGQSTKDAGKLAAQTFLQELADATGNLTQWGQTFAVLNIEASTDHDTISDWCDNHWKTYTDPDGNTISTWVDDEKADPNNPTNPIQGPQAMSFDQFIQDAISKLGGAIDPTSNTSVDDTINADYGSRIADLVAEFKGNPWALLVALMSLINDRDQDDGTGVDGFGDTTAMLKKANALIQKMLGDISGTAPDAADYFKSLNELKELVMKDPALAGIASQFLSDAGTVEGQTATFKEDMHWSIGKGYYNFPPGTKVTYTDANGKGHAITVPPDGVVYIGQDGGQFTIPAGDSDKDKVTFTFGQLAAMGDTKDIQATMGNWTTQAMSNFTNATTAIQTLLNSMSPAIQQEIQNTTQTMSARENFEKEAFASITNVNQQIMQLIRSILG